MDELQLEEIQARYDAVVQASEKFLEAMAELLRPVVEKINQILETWTRLVFSIRLQDFGLPTWLADFVAFRCPRRWLPYGWIYGGNTE